MTTGDLTPGEGTTYLAIDSIRVGERVRTGLDELSSVSA